MTAYGIYADGSSPQFRMQVLGGPGWIDSDHYDIAAKAEGTTSVQQLYGPMLRTLLEDRFRLKVHRETKEAPVYFLTVAKGGTRSCSQPGNQVALPWMPITRCHSQRPDSPSLMHVEAR